MSVATLTSKGQITLPKELREKLHLETGEKVDFRVDERNGIATLIPLNKRVDDVFGMMKRPGKPKPVSVEEMDRSVAAAFRKKGP